MFINMGLMKKENGFTLLELLIALSVLAIAVLAVAHALTVVSANRALSYHMGVASNLAQGKLEEIKLTPYGDISNGSETGINETGQSGGIYSRSWTSQTNIPINGTKTINVGVSWPLDNSTNVTLWTIKGQ